MAERILKIASRPSKLALIQVNEVMQYFPELNYSIKTIESFGDKNKDISLLDNSMADIFTREIDDSILAGKADLAVHSAKDLPWPLPEGLELAAVLPSIDNTDALYSRENQTIVELPSGAVVGTSSPERKRQLEQLRPDIEARSIRGTIEERIAQVENGLYDALVVATCALKRLKLEKYITEILPFKAHLLQGSLVVIVKKNNIELLSIFSKVDDRKNFGKVTLTGAGSGKLKWLTIEALESVEKADVLIYDDLIDRKILEHTKAEKIFVGKRPGNHSYEQNDINELIYQKAKLGKNVVRLKGGDPMIFGHAGEEIAFLESRMISVSVVPGITSAIGAAALSGIPLTLRNISSSVAFCTAHNPDIEIPSADTLVYYMGASNTARIAEKLLNKGYFGETPVKLIYNIGGEDQEIFSETLSTLAFDHKMFKSPIITIIGKVASKHNWHKAFESERKILYTGTHLEKYVGKGKITHHPLIEIIPCKNYLEFDKYIMQLTNYNYLIFTSIYSVEYFFKRWNHMGFDTRKLSTVKVVSIGRTTSEKLGKFGIIPDLQPNDESSEGIISMFRNKNIAPANILIPRSDSALPILPDGLRKLGHLVQTIIAYKNVLPDNFQKIDIERFDEIVFTSPTGVKNFFGQYGKLPENKRITTRGKVTQLEVDKVMNDRI
jgi:uroporphyrinogen III methyltransferase/synthase